MRSLPGVAAALAAMTVWCLIFLVPLYLILGPEAALSGDRTHFSTLWTGLAMVVCFGAAVLGGWLAHRLTNRIGAVVALTVAIAFIGLVDAGFNQFLLTHMAVLSTMPETFRLLLLMPEPAWYDWMLPPAMAAFVWIMGSGRALEMAPETPEAAARRRAFRDASHGG